MSDLIEKFFCEDLSEAEEKVLGEQLLRSEDAADRFGKLSEQKYISYGLPEPMLTAPGSDDDGFLKIWGKFILLLVSGLSIIGLTGWAMFNCVCRQGTTEVSAVSASSLETIAPIEKAASFKSAGSIAVKKIVQQDVEAPPTPEATDNTPPKGKGLQIVFHMSAEGRAAIRVLHPDGTEVRRLFDGNMKSGSWSVDWDGHLVDGKSAQPGLYRIEVNTNGAVKSREVRIR